MNRKMTEQQIKDCIIGDIPSNYHPPSWDVWFMQMVYHVASKSKDNSTKIGAVLVRNNRIVSVGYNGLPTGVNDNEPKRYERPEKYMWVKHAEENSILSAGRYGTSTNGCTLYTQAIPCSSCAGSSIQGGISEIVIHSPFEEVFHALKNNWDSSCSIGEIMLQESGVKIRCLQELIGVEGYVNGKIVHV